MAQLNIYLEIWASVYGILLVVNQNKGTITKVTSYTLVNTVCSTVL